MSRRRKPQVAFVPVWDPVWIRIVHLRPVEAARRERVRRQIGRVKRRAARQGWSA